MTLVVCWFPRNELHCVADSRISGAQGKVTITDAGPKIFPIPVLVTAVEDNRVTGTARHTFGFAFAGATLLAGNTHAIASIYTQQLTRVPARLPSLQTVANIYARVAEYMTADVGSRRNEVDTFSAFIFGQCPVEKKLRVAKLVPHLESNTFRVNVEIFDAAPQTCHLFGSGAHAFEEALKKLDDGKRAIDPLTIIRNIVASDTVAGVGGYLQMAVATAENFELRHIASPDDANPDEIKISLVGFDLRNLGDLEGFGVGYLAIGLGTEKVMGRRALRAKGVDPDAGPVSQEFHNLAAMEAALAYLVEHKSTSPDARTLLDTGKVYRLASTTPASGTWYIATRCSNCGNPAPICLDPSMGSIPKPFKGEGHINVDCFFCHRAIAVGANEMEAIRWP